MALTNSAGTVSPVTHVIFDMDGLLLDTEILYTEAIQTVASKFDKIYPWELKVRCMGMKGDLAAKLMVEELQLPISVSEFIESINEQYKVLFPNSKFLPGAERLVHHLHSHKVPIAIATGSSKESFDLKTKKHKEFISLFNHVVLGSTDPEVKMGKPEPDIFLVCARRFSDNPDPKKCLVFEDAPNGLQAAMNANMQVIMVPDARLHKDKSQGATEVLSSLEDFKPELFGLPPFQS